MKIFDFYWQSGLYQITLSSQQQCAGKHLNPLPPIKMEKVIVDEV
jgi:hypothetical protein